VSGVADPAWDAVRRLIASVWAIAFLALAGCTGNSAAPDAISQGNATDIVGLEVTCPGLAPGGTLSLLVGQETDLCDATARQRNGVTALVGQQAAWSVVRPDLV